MTTPGRDVPALPKQGTPDSVRRPPQARPWRLQHLLLAPHRLGFFLAMVVLVTAGAWWSVVQLDRLGLGPQLTQVVSPSLVHGAVMSLGFFPLFFSGFLFTAGPKWLGVQAPEAPRLTPMLSLQAVGWLVWLLGASTHASVALVGLALVWAGLAWMTLFFVKLVRHSTATDRVHATTIGVACVVGVMAIGGVALAVLNDRPDIALVCVQTGLWGFVVVVFVSVAHRMIPFFTSSALPFVKAWRPFWVLWLMLASVTLEVVAAWVNWGGAPTTSAGTAWSLMRAGLELAAGGVLIWLALVWGLIQSLSNRLLAMLHIGFLWLGLAFALGGATQLAGALGNTPALPLGALHALTMGCLGSLMLAMVTRVSCGHGGHPLVADNLTWLLFWLLQAATLTRLVATLETPYSAWLLGAAALAWALIMATWGVRLGSWYGRIRADGRPG